MEWMSVVMVFCSPKPVELMIAIDLFCQQIQHSVSLLVRASENAHCPYHLLTCGSKRNTTKSMVEVHLIHLPKQSTMFLYLDNLPSIPRSCLLQVMMVCILNQIPIFAVGKPGNSKSLALRILHASLRGPDSEVTRPA